MLLRYYSYYTPGIFSFPFPISDIEQVKNEKKSFTFR